MPIASQTRYAAPAHLTSANAVADAASSAARPNAATSVWTTQPAMIPSADEMPPAMPWRRVLASVNIMSTPGVALTTRTVAANTPSECVPSIAPELDR